MLGAPTFKLQPNETAHLWSPRMTVRWERKRDHYQRHPLGGWDVWADHVVIKCADGAERKAITDIGSSQDDALEVFVVPERTHVIVQLRKDRAEEGEYGPVVHAMLVAGTSGCPITDDVFPGVVKGRIPAGWRASQRDEESAQRASAGARQIGKRSLTYHLR